MELILIKFFKKNFLLLSIIISISLIFSKNKILNLANINNYDHINFWKFTSLLNNVKFNLIIILILVIYININKNLFKKIQFFFIFVCIYYSIFFGGGVCVNFLKLDVDFFSKKLNIALLNGILNIHPWLTYTTYSLIIYTYFNLDNLKKKHTNISLNVKNNIKYSIIKLVTFSIFLGSYWAFQELSWGGWWNWDVVELISLNFFFYIVLSTHKNVINFFFKKINFLKILVIFLISFIIVRFNLLTSVHAFINTNKNVVFFYNYFFIIIFFIVLIAFFKKLWVSKSSISNYNFKKKSYFFFFNVYIISILIYIVTFLFYVFFFKKYFLEFNVFFEFFFLLYLNYLILNFLNLKLNNYKNIYFNIFINNYLIFTTQLIIFNFKIKDNFKKWHLFTIIIFILIYYLKIYFIYKSIFLEIYLFRNYNTIMYYINNNNFKFINYTIYKNFIICENIFTNSKFNILNFELKIHFYKNLIFYFNKFFIKLISPNNNLTMFIYSNLFLIFVFIYVKLIWFKLKNKLKIN